MFKWCRQGRRASAYLDTIFSGRSAMSQAFLEATDGLQWTEDDVDRLLQLARRRLGLELAWIAHFDGACQVVESVNGTLPNADVPVGFFSPLAGSYCTNVISGAIPAVVADTSAHPVTAALAITQELGIGAYVAAPLRTSDDQIYGTLCCFSSNPEPALRQRDGQFLQLLADLLADSMDLRMRRRQERNRVRDLVQAVIDAGGPTVVFQSVFSVPDMTVVGYEALARFPDDFAGPEQWFHRAHQVGLGTELEVAAVGRACSSLAELPKSAFLALNVSPAALCSVDLPPVLAQWPGHRLILEITEHEQITDYCAIREIMGQLRATGIRFAADDAGAGYSGMGQLVELRPEVIKMDRSLTQGMDADPARTAMATALVSFAAASGAALIVEGVETAAELRTAIDLGIGLVQGYHLSCPEPLAGLEPAAMR